MSNTHLTRCPHCQATFKVQDQHLNAAGGKVRCGSCLEVFNALESLIDSPKTKAPPAKEQNNKPPQASEKATTESASVQADDEDGDLVFADNPDEDSEDEGYTGPGTFSSELSDSFLEIEKGGSSQFADSDFIDDLDDDVSSKKTGSDESWAEQMLEDIETEAPRPSKAAPERKPEKQQEHSFSFSDEFSALDETRQPASQPARHEDDSTIEIAEQTPPIQAQRPDETELRRQYQDLKVDPIGLPSDSERSFLGNLVWTLLNLSLLVVLLAQLAWFHYDKLAQYDQLRPLYEKACHYIGCKLPDLVDTTLIRSQNLIVRSHPTARKALIIDAIIINQASYDQPFPNLALYFSDLNNKVIAQRLFEPQDYLAGEGKQWESMPTSTPIHISLEILDPGSEAVNYSVGFFRHTPRN